MKKRKRRSLTKKSICFVAIIVALSLAWHVAHVSPPLPQVTYTYTIDSVSIKIQGRDSQNIPIKTKGLPGTMVIDDDYVFIALVNRDSYEAAQHTAPIVEYYPNGMSISVLPVFLTAGPYEMMVNEQIVANKQHDPNEGEKKMLTLSQMPAIMYDGRKFRFM